MSDCGLVGATSLVHHYGAASAGRAETLAACRCVLWSESLRISSSIAQFTESIALWIREMESPLTCSGAVFLQTKARRYFTT